MLVALSLRGVAFDFRVKAKTHHRPLWDKTFYVGSILASWSQGFMLGQLITGFKQDTPGYVFSALIGFCLVFAYRLLGAGWLIMKTEGGIQNRMRRYAWIAAIATLSLMALVSILTPFQDMAYFERWFAWPSLLFSLVIPLLVLFAAKGLFTGLNDHRDASPFLYSLLLFVLCFVGIAISFFPYLVPPSLTLWDVAAPYESLRFALVGTVVLVPIILAYTAYAYWVFRVKVNPSEGYH